ncbi:YgaP family membrane protein [Neobacillus sp. SM06]|uniref:YgaP family membrane protein n=1 Tax=Neobacillus sp. SM06 TaxID=3422492 RepID=UPI003D2E3D70
MNVKPNITILNALIRITIGLTIVAWGTAKLVKWPWRESYLLAILLGAMKVGEGIVRYCPATDLYKKSTTNGQTASRDSMEGLDQDEVLPYNPT